MALAKFILARSSLRSDRKTVRGVSLVPPVLIILTQLVALLAPPSTVSAESLNAWLAAGRHQPAILPGTASDSELIRFEPAESGPPLTEASLLFSDGQTARAVRRPNGGYLGRLSVSAPVSGGFPAENSLTLTVRYSPLVSEIDHTSRSDTTTSAAQLAAASHRPSNFNPDISRSDLVETFQFDGSDSAARGIDWYLPIHSLRSYSNPTIAMLITAELSTIDDHRTPMVLSRRFLIVAVLNESGSPRQDGWVAGGAQTDRALREVSGTTEIVTIPPKVHPGLAWSDARATWIVPEMFDDLSESDFRQSGGLRSLREALLAGTWMYGERAFIETLRKRLSLPARSAAILLGGLTEGDHPSPQLALERFGAPPSFSDFDTIGSIDDRDPRGALMPSHPFGKDGRRYWQWTIVMLAGYGVLLVIGIPIVFRRLRNERAPLLWLSIPCVAVVALLFISLAGTTVLNRQSSVILSEYRFSYAPWPETLVHTATQVLAIRPQTIRLSTPWIAQTEYYSSWGKRSELRRRNLSIGEHPRTELEYSLRDRGTLHTIETRGFANLPAPLTRVSENRLRTLEPFESLWIWNDRGWQSFGPLEAGAEVTLADRNTASPPRLPQILRTLFEHPIGTTIYETPAYGSPNDAQDLHTKAMRHLAAEGTFPDSVVALGRMKGAPLAELSSSDPNERSSAVYWIVQLPPAGG